MSGDISGCHDSGRRGVTGMYWPEARDSANHPPACQCLRRPLQQSHGPKCQQCRGGYRGQWDKGHILCCHFCSMVKGFTHYIYDRCKYITEEEAPFAWLFKQKT